MLKKVSPDVSPTGTLAAVHNERGTAGLPERVLHLFREARWIVLCFAGLFLLCVLLTYNPRDPGWSQAVPARHAANFGGLVGAWVADFMLYLFGLSSYLFSAFLFERVVSGYRALHAHPSTLLGSSDAARGAAGMADHDSALPGFRRARAKLRAAQLAAAQSGRFPWERWLGFALLLCGCCGLESARLYNLGASLPLGPGGLIGTMVARPVHELLGLVGGTLALLIVIAIGFSLTTGLSWLGLFEATGRLLEQAWMAIVHRRTDAGSVQTARAGRRQDRQSPRDTAHDDAMAAALVRQSTDDGPRRSRRGGGHVADTDGPLPADAHPPERPPSSILQDRPSSSSAPSAASSLPDAIARPTGRSDAVQAAGPSSRDDAAPAGDTPLSWIGSTLGNTVPAIKGQGTKALDLIRRGIGDASAAAAGATHARGAGDTAVPGASIATPARASTSGDALNAASSATAHQNAARDRAVASEKPVQMTFDQQKTGPLKQQKDAGELPPLNLLDPPPEVVETVSAETIEYTSRLIERKLKDFGVSAQVVHAFPGPVITRYEVEPATGVKGSQIVNLAKDLARALSLVSLRVVETIPGKNLMGLELPNPRRQTVRLSEIIGSDVYVDGKSPLTMALGKDIAGEPVVADLGKMPHLLVAGTTGSGKSVGINAMLISLLYKADPSRVRLILIDPKMLEMSVYEGIPHLLAPVVTDMRQAGNALNWCVSEMERRYRIMSKLGVRNLAGYNQKIADAKAREELIPNPFSLTPDAPEPLDHLPVIVVVIDELADLMMVVGKKIEELIARLAQKARAAGIHLILATQRPSVDVITGLIKANIPTRMAFQVSSKIDSRTILDQMGAESLLGQGDMLYQPPGSSVPLRVHGAYVADEEVHKVVENWKERGGEPDYIEGILEGGVPEDVDKGSAIGFGGLSQTLSEAGVDMETDPMYDQAVAVVVQHRRASISLVQRHLRIGYNRAARLLEQMEKSGLVSSMATNGNREILVPAGAGGGE